VLCNWQHKEKEKAMVQQFAEELYGVIGFPLGHSLSPLVHNTAFQALGRAALMFRWAVPPEGIADFMRAVRVLPVRGCCITLPHKVAILPFLDVVSPLVHRVGACNTLYWQGDRLCGENTDVTGFMSPLLSYALPAQCPALVLGAGGAARAVVIALQELGLHNIYVSARRQESTQRFCDEFAVTPVAWHERGDVAAELVVNTTPAGMLGKDIESSAYPQEAFKARQGIAYDIVYTPQETRFLREARRAGWQCIGGLAMFLGQAERQCALWTGASALPQEAQEAVRKVLQA
jgi:shikimate dehydrogenase